MSIGFKVAFSALLAMVLGLTACSIPGSSGGDNRKVLKPDNPNPNENPDYQLNIDSKSYLLIKRLIFRFRIVLKTHFCIWQSNRI